MKQHKKMSRWNNNTNKCQDETQQPQKKIKILGWNYNKKQKLHLKKTKCQDERTKQPYQKKCQYETTKNNVAKTQKNIMKHRNNKKETRWNNNIKTQT